LTHFCIEKLFSAITIIISIAYILAFFLSGQFSSLHILRSLLGFIMLTYLLGATVRIFLKSVVKFSNLPSTLSIEGLTCDILMSFLVSLMVSIVLIRTFLFCEVSMIASIITLSIILNLFTLRSLERKSVPSPIGTSAPKISTASFVTAWIVLLGASLLFAGYFRSKTPIPTINGWDMNSALAYVNWIVSHHGYHYLLVPSFPAGATPYPALFFYFVSSYSSFLGVEPYSLFWFSVCPLIFGYMFLVFLIALKFSKNVWLSIMSSFIAFFSSVAYAEVVRNPLYLTLDMVSQIIFLLIIVFNIYYHNHGIEKKITNVLVIICLTLFNYFTAIVVLPFLLWAIIDNKKLPFLGDGRRAFRISAVSMALCAPILIALTGYMTPVLTSLFSSSAFPISSKVEILQIIYPMYFWVLFVLALFSVIVHKTYYKKIDSPYLDMLLYIFCGFTLYFLPVWITYRMEFYLRVFLAISISGLSLLFSKEFLAKILGSSYKKLRKKKISLGATISFLLLLVTITQMYPLFTQYNFHAYISKDEYDAAEWIKKNTSSSAYILTDPSSGYVIRGLALRNASNFLILPDGRMPADSSTLYPDLIGKIHKFLYSQAGFEWAEITQYLQFNEIYVVITSRTVSWALSSPETTLTHPVEGVNYSRVTSKFVEPYFHEMYNSNTIQIYRPDPSLRVDEVTVWSDSNFTEGWTWYLDGSYGEHSFDTDGDVLTLNAQTTESTSAWVGLTKEMNCSGAIYLEIRSKIDAQPYHLEVVLYDVTRTRVSTFRMAGDRPLSTWVVEQFSLTSSEANKVSEIGLIIWTKDTHRHTWEIDYVMFTHSAFSINGN